MPRPGRRPGNRGRRPTSPRPKRTPTPRPQPAPGRVAVGIVRRPWGTDGSLAVTPFADDPQRMSAGSRVYVNGKPAVITRSHRSGNALVVRVDNVDTMEQAEPLRGTLIEAAEEDLPALPEGTYYHHQLIGSVVRTVDGEEIGTVESVLETGSNDVYVVHPSGGGRQVLVPATKDVIKDIDLQAGTITVDLPEGLAP